MTKGRADHGGKHGCSGRFRGRTKGAIASLNRFVGAVWGGASGKAKRCLFVMERPCRFCGARTERIDEIRTSGLKPDEMLVGDRGRNAASHQPTGHARDDQRSQTVAGLGMSIADYQHRFLHDGRRRGATQSPRATSRRFKTQRPHKQHASGGCRSHV